MISQIKNTKWKVKKGVNKDLSFKASGLQKCFFFLGITLKLGRPGVPGGNISLKLEGTLGIFCCSSTFSKLSLSL
jgi:hypothetical protein